MRALARLLALAAAVAEVGSSRVAPADDDVVTVALSGARLSGPLPSDFVGYSIEVQRTQTMLGSPGALRSSFAALMRTLQALTPGGAGPNIRPGGSSADSVMWLPDAEQCAGARAGVIYCVNQTDLDAYAAAVRQWNGSITLDVNLRWLDAPAVAAAAAHVAAAVATLGWGDGASGGGGVLDGVELGNEPDLFHDGLRPSNYSYADYLTEFNELLAQLVARAPGALPRPSDGRGVQGGTYCCDRGFTSQWPSYIAAHAEVLSSASQHVYPGVNGVAGQDDLPWLLSDNCSVAVRAKLSPWAAAAADRGVRFVVGEGNSVNNGGLHNVSDVCGTALWGADVLFNAAAAGATRWNFHGGPWDYYDSIRYPNTSLHAPPQVQPLFYGQWLFSAAVANHSALLNASVVASTNPRVKVWAALAGDGGGGGGGGRGGVLKVAVLHKDLAAAGAARVTFTLPAGWAPAAGVAASVARLTCPGPYATAGLAFGGLTFDGTPDGTPSGVPSTEALAPNADGVSFTLSVPPIAGALVAVQLAAGAR